MRRIVLRCNKTTKFFDKKLAVYFHGFLMGKVSPRFCEQIHETGANPFSLVVINGNDFLEFVVNLLNDESVEEFSTLLLNSGLSSFILESSEQKEFKILKKEIFDFQEKELVEIFYKDHEESFFNIQIQSPIAFKSDGEYIFLPDIRLFFQSLMRKYSANFEGTEKIDLDLLDEIVRTIRLIDYRLGSERYFIHNSFIKGFRGQLVFKCLGNQTLRNYVNMLLQFGEFSGVGVKNSLGMGAIKLIKKERK